MSRMYAIRDRNEAEAYLRHPVLFPRLSEMTCGGRGAAQEWRRNRRSDGLVDRRDQTRVVDDAVSRRRVAPARARRRRAFAGFVSLADEILAAASREGYPPCKESLAITAPRG